MIENKTVNSWRSNSWYWNQTVDQCTIRQLIVDNQRVYYSWHPCCVTVKLYLCGVWQSAVSHGLPCYLLSSGPLGYHCCSTSSTSRTQSLIIRPQLHTTSVTLQWTSQIQIVLLWIIQKYPFTKTLISYYLCLSNLFYLFLPHLFRNFTFTKL